MGKKSLWNVVLLANDRPNNIKLLGVYENQRKRVLNVGCGSTCFCQKCVLLELTRKKMTVGCKDIIRKCIYIFHITNVRSSV